MDDMGLLALEQQQTALHEDVMKLLKKANTLMDTDPKKAVALVREAADLRRKSQ